MVDCTLAVDIHRPPVDGALFVPTSVRQAEKHHRHQYSGSNCSIIVPVVHFRFGGRRECSAGNGQASCI